LGRKTVGGNRGVKHFGVLMGLCLGVAACNNAPPPPPPTPRSSADMVEECQRLLKQGYSVGSVENPRATYKVFGDLTTVEIAATYKTTPDGRADPVGFRCLFEKGKLFQAGAANF
jgi:hypothetical protein